jgi:hypothetical protein
MTMSPDDADFLARFEAATIPNAAFRHRDHLRMAWLYVRRDGAAVGGVRIRDGLRHFAAAHGVAHAYHETLTGFWARLMAHAVEAFPADDRFEDVLARYAGFEDRRLAYRHWSSERLDGPVARRQWVEPDRLPLP